MVMSMCVHACEHVHNLNDCIFLFFLFMSVCACVHLCFHVF